MQRIDVGASVLGRDFTFDRLADAIKAMREDGIVCLNNASQFVVGEYSGWS